MADEYINKQLLLESMQKSLDSSPDGYAVVGAYGFCVAMQIIDKYPTADVAPVVRCKDCRHIHIGKEVYYCRYWERWGLTPNGFCSNGAKMDKEGDDGNT